MWVAFAHTREKVRLVCFTGLRPVASLPLPLQQRKHVAIPIPVVGESLANSLMIP